MRVSEEWFKEKFGTLPERGKVFRPERAPKKNKYGSEKSGGYDSKREHRRANDLKCMQKAGLISKLREQVVYDLIPAQRDTSGKLLERKVYYKADFVYVDKDGNEIVEDTKGKRTAEYIIKRKLMLWIHGIKVVEV